MPTAIRQLKINGYLLTETASATILVNGVESYNGPLAPGLVGPTDPSEQIALATFDYVGQLDTDETIEISVLISNGGAAIGQAFVNCQQTSGAPAAWRRLTTSTTDDGRTNIQIDGEPYPWPTDNIPEMPGGTPENPIWTGWTFIVGAGETLSFNYFSLAAYPLPPAA